jgi:type IV secretory pathway VirB10-like protein
MISKPVLIGVLAAACATAAAGGAFVAVRQNAADRAASAVLTSDASAPATATQPTKAAQPVAETEAVVSPPTSQPTAQPPAAAQTPATSVAAPAEAPERSRPKADASSKRARDRAPAARADRPATVAPKRIDPPASAPAPGTTEPNVARDPAPVSAATAEAPPVESGRLPEVVLSVPEPRFIEVVLPASSVIGLQLETSTTSETARVEDRVEARVTRDVIAAGRTAIPAGSRMIGSVTLVERGGKIKEQARLNVRFHTLVLANGTEMPLRTEPILREGEAPSGDSSRKIGGAAVGGAILGAILGGGKGAMIGGATGAGAGTAAVMAGDRKAATLRSGETVTVKLSSPVNIEVQKEQ